MNVKELAEKGNYDFSDLCEIMRILRSENGCAWDREQTHRSIRSNFIEEVYEAIEGIDKDDEEILREELGDVLLQVVFHSRISQENGAFDIDDVVNDVCKKLIIRHPHVFADVVADNAEQVLENWNEIKKQTKGQRTLNQTLTSVSASLPSLMRAEKIAKKIRKAGHCDNINDYTKELPASFSAADISEKNIGKLLFSICSLAEKNGIDCEKALYDTCNDVINTIID